VIRRLCVAVVSLGAIALAAPTASASETPSPSLRVKEGVCVVQRDLGLAYCASNPFPYLRDLLPSVPAAPAP
jgi:hypothetical protein